MNPSTTETFNAASILIDSHLAEGREGNVAIHYEDRQITYGKMAEMVNRSGNVFLDLGTEIEGRVALVLLDCPEFIYSFFGAVKIGAIPVAVSTLLTPADYEYIINDSRAKSVVISAELLPQLATIRRRLRHVKHVVVVGGKAPEDCLGFEALMERVPPSLDAAETTRDDPAFWLYSSGSTGSPKGTVHLHHDMICVADAYGKHILEIRPDDICYSVAKLFFAYGLGNASYLPFRVGASAVLVRERPLPETIYKTVTKYQPTLFFGVPTAYNNMLPVASPETKDALASVRCCVSAGEALPESLYRQWFDRFGLEILDGIGSTEMLHIFISNRAGRVMPGSSGLLVPGYQARIIDEDGRDLPDGEVGTLLVKGDSAAAYYWNKHEKTKHTMLGPWLNTGDQYRRDADGYFWYAGRGDDMLKVGGIWVSPIEVENTLLEHPAVFEVAVVGAEDDERLVKPKAFVVPNPGYEPSEELAETLKLFVKTRIAPYKFPRWIEFVEELPKTATGKIQRYRLRLEAV